MSARFSATHFVRFFRYVMEAGLSVFKSREMLQTRRAISPLMLGLMPVAIQIKLLGRSIIALLPSTRPLSTFAVSAEYKTRFPNVVILSKMRNSCIASNAAVSTFSKSSSPSLFGLSPDTIVPVLLAQIFPRKPRGSNHRKSSWRGWSLIRELNRVFGGRPRQQSSGNQA